MTERENTDRDALIAELVEALEPFARVGTEISRVWPNAKPELGVGGIGSALSLWGVTFGDFRNAAAMVTKASHIQKGGA